MDNSLWSKSRIRRKFYGNYLAKSIRISTFANKWV